MIDAPVGFAFAAGLVAAFNPCGFALLPAYLARFLGLGLEAENSAVVRPLASALSDAARVSVGLTAGFVAVFLIAGTLITQASVTVQTATPWASVAIGVALAIFGLASLVGWKPQFNLPRLQRGGGDAGLVSIALFGASYATVSLSCTIPAFLVAVSGTFDRGGFINGVSVFIAYGLGMGVALAVITGLAAVFRVGVVRKMRRVAAVVPRVAGLLLLVTGAYVAYYGLTEIQLERGGDLPSGPVDFVGEASAFVIDFIDGRGVFVAVAATVLLVSTVAVRARRTRPS